MLMWPMEGHVHVNVVGDFNAKSILVGRRLYKPRLEVEESWTWCPAGHEQCWIRRPWSQILEDRGLECLSKTSPWLNQARATSCHQLKQHEMLKQTLWNDENDLSEMDYKLVTQMIRWGGGATIYVHGAKGNGHHGEQLDSTHPVSPVR